MPSISHQLCQFHALREASRPIYEQDRKLKVEIRKALQECVRKVRKQLQQQRQNATQAEAAQVAVLADYALGIQSAINLEGKQPFTYAGIAVYDALMALQESLEQVEKLEALIEQRPAQLHLVQVTLEELERSNVFLVPLNEHTANLYRKLSVNNCRAAVSLAKSLAKKCLFGQVFPHLSEKGKTWPKGEGGDSPKCKYIKAFCMQSSVFKGCISALRTL